MEVQTSGVFLKCVAESASATAGKDYYLHESRTQLKSTGIANLSCFTDHGKADPSLVDLPTRIIVEVSGDGSHVPTGRVGWNIRASVH